METKRKCLKPPSERVNYLPRSDEEVKTDSTVMKISVNQKL